MALPHPSHRADPLVAHVDARPSANVDERLRRALLRLGEIDGFVAAAVSRRDGLAIQHSMKTSGDAARLCAMAAALTGASGSAGTELKQGEFSYAIVRYGKGVFVVREAGHGAVVAALLASDAKLGMVLLRLQEVSMTVGDILEEVS